MKFATPERTALELLRFKTAKQLREGDKVSITESDVQEILFIAGMKLNEEVTPIL